MNGTHTQMLGILLHMPNGNNDDDDNDNVGGKR